MDGEKQATNISVEVRCTVLLSMRLCHAGGGQEAYLLERSQHYALLPRRDLAPETSVRGPPPLLPHAGHHIEDRTLDAVDRGGVRIRRQRHVV